MTKSYHDAIWPVLQKVLASETSETTNSDAHLAFALQGEGVLATELAVREVRIMHGIQGKFDRRRALYQREFKRARK